MASKRVAVEVRELSKRYMISHQEKHRYIGDALLEKLKNPFARPTREEFWALKDVSFDVEPGEVLGIVGRNGAGKSTMLKMLSGIAEPTSGEIRLHGKVGALLEVGTGFHPELTGRENVFLNGTILGMRRREVERKFDEIVDFAEVERFIDTPVKRYSSGMYVRLAFAIAANLDPEILIVDEVLAVGDAKFQAKCIGKMKDIAAGEGRTVLFVSHAAPAVRQLCTKALLLRHGQVQYFGDVGKALALYDDVDLVESDTIVGHAVTLKEGIVLDDIVVNGSGGADLDLRYGETSLDIVIRGRATESVAARLGVMIRDPLGIELAHFGEGLREGVTPTVAPGPFEWRVSVDLPRNLNAGTYTLELDLAEHNVVAYVRVPNALKLHVEGVPVGSGDPLKYQDKYGLVMLDGTVDRRSSVERTAH